MDILRRQMNRLVYTGKFQRLEAVALKLFLAEFSNHDWGSLCMVDTRPGKLYNSLRHWSHGPVEIADKNPHE